MMFVAWGILLPGGILAASYLKSMKGDGWYQIHVYLQYSRIAIMFFGDLFAATELRGFYVSSVHVKFDVVALMLAGLQPQNAYFRPKILANGEVPAGTMSSMSTYICYHRQVSNYLRSRGIFHGKENAEGLT
jgi:hypothetical protein